MKRLPGIPAASGYAIGPAHQFRPATFQVERHFIEDASNEIARLDKAVIAAVEQINAVVETARTELTADEAAIFEAQLLMLQDPELLY